MPLRTVLIFNVIEISLFNVDNFTKNDASNWHSAKKIPKKLQEFYYRTYLNRKNAKPLHEFSCKQSKYVRPKLPSFAGDAIFVPVRAF